MGQESFRQVNVEFLGTGMMVTVFKNDGTMAWFREVLEMSGRTVAELAAFRKLMFFRDLQTSAVSKDSTCSQNRPAKMMMKFIKKVHVILTRNLRSLVICYGLDALPHVPSVGVMLDENLDFLSISTLHLSYCTVKVGSSCFQNHQFARFKYGIPCFQHGPHHCSNPSFVVGPCGDVPDYSDVLHTLQDVS